MFANKYSLALTVACALITGCGENDAEATSNEETEEMTERAQALQSEVDELVELLASHASEVEGTTDLETFQAAEATYADEIAHLDEEMPFPQPSRRKHSNSPRIPKCSPRGTMNSGRDPTCFA